jgi:hypothetical protein
MHRLPSRISNVASSVATKFNALSSYCSFDRKSSNVLSIQFFDTDYVFTAKPVGVKIAGFP